MNTILYLFRLILTTLVLSSLVSCIQPPPPRVYSPNTARHLWHVAHDVPVTPMPAERGTWWGWSGPYYGYYY
jgi:hypothetical protein